MLRFRGLAPDYDDLRHEASSTALTAEKQCCVASATLRGNAAPLPPKASNFLNARTPGGEQHDGRGWVPRQGRYKQDDSSARASNNQVDFQILKSVYRGEQAESHFQKISTKKRDRKTPKSATADLTWRRARLRGAPP